jgi:hypothetical protein
MWFLNEIKADESLRNIPVVVQSGASEMTGVDTKEYTEDLPHRDRKTKALGGRHGRHSRSLPRKTRRSWNVDQNATEIYVKPFAEIS